MMKFCMAVVLLAACQLRVSAQSPLSRSGPFKSDGIQFPTTLSSQYPDSLALDSIVVAYKTSNSIPGIASLIVKDGRIIWKNNYGYRNVQLQLPVEDSTLFFMASVSKLFVATAVMQLWEGGYVQLDNNINDYLPSDLQVRNPSFPDDPITARMLLTHTSSIQDNWGVLMPRTSCGDYPIGLSSFLADYLPAGGKYYYAGNYTDSHPGQQYLYSNVGVSLLAVIVEHVTGKPFDEYCKENIFTPLSMDSTRWFLKGSTYDQIAIPYGNAFSPLCQLCWVLYPSLNLRSSMVELSHFLSAYLHHGVYEGKRILDSASVAFMLSDRLGYMLEGGAIEQGLIWFRCPPIGPTVWGHNGQWEGTEPYIGVSPSEDFIVVWLQNWSEGGTAPYVKLIGMMSAFNNYAHLCGKIYAVKSWVDKHFVRGGIDSVLFRTRFANAYRHDFSAHLIYTSSDSSVIDSLILLDDGSHEDVIPNDGIYSRNIPPVPAGEDFYSLSVSTTDNSSGSYFLTRGICGFTTAGPVTVDSVQSVPHPGYVDLKPYVTNRSESTTISGATIKIYCYDPWVTTNSTNENPLPTMAPGAHVSCARPSTLMYDESLAPDPLHFNLQFEILKNGLPYWIKTRVGERSPVPTACRLEQNYPNPFNPTTNIRFGVPSPGFVVLKVYDILGREVKTLVNEKQSPGSYVVKFDASGLPSGVYFYRLVADNQTITKKMLIMK